MGRPPLKNKHKLVQLKNQMRAQGIMKRPPLENKHEFVELRNQMMAQEIKTVCSLNMG